LATHDGVADEIDDDILDEGWSSPERYLGKVSEAET